MRVLVTGGAGYIGSVVAEALLARGHAVVVYDSLVKGHRDAVPDGAPLVHGDVLDGVSLGRELREHRIDAVAHLAADALVGESMANPARYYHTNLVGGLTLLDAMRATGVGLLVFSSSAAVYGAPEKQPIPEDEPPAPTNPYGETKLAMERAIAWYGRAWPLRGISLRYFNAAGAGARTGERHDPETHLIPIVLQAAAGRRDAVTIYGDDYPTRDGTCVRDYVHVLDLAHAHVLAVDALAAGAPTAVYNLGCGGEGYTVREVIETAAVVTGRRIRARVGPRRPGDPPVLVAATGRITRDLGWRAERQDLAEIIRSAWDWVQRTR
ncbi:MAG TPA: UDP-glucose 4-epimerase GalE [Methylomirabilota bacterium]|jgi:UDP-glucose 4-epimerase|nr:UDP-glucose 4-epimerase GalE [Methylomirabilota bacterium]